LRNIKDVYKKHAAELNAIDDVTKRSDLLVEYNVIESVENISETSIVQNAWKNGKELHIHGWVYSLETGLIKDLKVSNSNNSKMDNVFRFI
ncbi:MAG: carbonic anhydrase, partial [Sphingobacteriaceae bacterium]